MTTCHYCGWHNSHNTYCPTIHPDVMKTWREGWELGRSGGRSPSLNPHFCLGYQQGLMALEEAEDSCTWDPGLM